MRPKRRRLVACLIAVLPSAISSAVLADSATVRIRIPTRSARGSVFCRLFKNGDGFPSQGYLAEQATPATATPASCSFSGLAPGAYAVAVFHDENGNGKLDRGFLGIPKEGVGVSNNRLRRMGPPRFEDARFTLESSDVSFDITLRY